MGRITDTEHPEASWQQGRENRTEYPPYVLWVGLGILFIPTIVILGLVKFLGWY